MNDTEITEVTREMRKFTEPFVCPLSHEPNETVVRLRGTGNLIEVHLRRLLLTCEHVVTGSRKLSFRPHGTDQPLKLDRPFAMAPDPYDVAVARIPCGLWQAVPHQGTPIPRDLFALTHHPVEDELLFFRGFAGENSAFAFEVLASHSTSYTTQEVKDADAPDSRYFFYLHHQPEKVTVIDSKNTRFENPSGFSGSLVWDTRYLQCAQQQAAWSPEMARVTGLVLRWTPSDPGIVALRVEQLNSYLLSAVEDMYSNDDWGLFPFLERRLLRRAFDSDRLS